MVIRGETLLFGLFYHHQYKKDTAVERSSQNKNFLRFINVRRKKNLKPEVICDFSSEKQGLTNTDLE
jgi:hypothetical protein